MSSERYPITLTSRTLCEALWDIDAKISAMEKERDDALKTAAYWERMYHSEKNKQIKPGWVTGSAIEEQLIGIPELEEVEAMDLPF